jgi:diacylglycerol kinase family enzyme
LGLQGPIVRLSPLRSAKEMVQSSVRDGVSTIVIVGDDVTVDRVMSFLPDLGLPIGYLPIRSPCRIAERFGIRSGLSACDVLAARHLDIVDVGVINDQYFFYFNISTCKSQVLLLQTKSPFGPVCYASI